MAPKGLGRGFTQMNADLEIANCISATICVNGRLIVFTSNA